MTKAGSKGGNLRDKLDGNELDLSLSDLNEVPVKELAALPKATVLDLSCNKLSTLPSDFCGLTHLVKLDLSKNKLQQLPADFGRLVNLQHLDLLNNRLVTLPVSFAQLKNLKWLDLKDNPLDPVLAKVAGDCLDEKQCKQCANKVLQHMKAVQADQERERQRRLEVEREAEKKREAKQQAMEGRTVLIIAHRLSTIKNANFVAVLDHGKICEHGTHEELLLKPNGLYRKLMNKQSFLSYNGAEQFLEPARA